MSTSRWRLAAGTAVILILAVLSVRLVPIYMHSLELQQFVEKTTRRPEAPASSDAVLRSWVLAKAAELDLPLRANNVLIQRTAQSLHIEVRYDVRVDLPLYTVNLHFYPGAGSR
jgi:hypothetical protein